MANISGELGYLTKDGSRNLTLKQQSVLDKVALGETLENAIKAVSYKQSSISNVKEKFQKYLDSNPKMVKKSALLRQHIIDKALEGDRDYIIPAERISTRVQERIDPIKRQDNDAGAVIQFTQFNIQLIKNE